MQVRQLLREMTEQLLTLAERLYDLAPRGAPADGGAARAGVARGRRMHSTRAGQSPVGPPPTVYAARAGAVRGAGPCEHC